MLFSWAKYILGFKEIIRDVYKDLQANYFIQKKFMYIERKHIHNKRNRGYQKPKDKRIVKNYIVYQNYLVKYRENSCFNHIFKNKNHFIVMNPQIKTSGSQMMEPLKFLPFSNSMNLRELLYSYHSHSEPTELPLGFYIPIINYIFMHLPTT